MEKLHEPSLEELKNGYKVREFDCPQGEKETTLTVDKQDGIINFYSRIGSHIKKVINSGNEKIKVTEVLVEDGKIRQIMAQIPCNSMTISVKAKPRKSDYISRLVT